MFYIKLFLIAFAWSFVIIWLRLFWRDPMKFDSFSECLVAISESFETALGMYINIFVIAVVVILLLVLCMATYNLIAK